MSDKGKGKRKLSPEEEEEERRANKRRAQLTCEGLHLQPQNQQHRHYDPVYNGPIPTLYDCDLSQTLQTLDTVHTQNQKIRKLPQLLQPNLTKRSRGQLARRQRERHLLNSHENPSVNPSVPQKRKKPNELQNHCNNRSVGQRRRWDKYRNAGVSILPHQTSQTQSHNLPPIIGTTHSPAVCTQLASLQPSPTITIKPSANFTSTPNVASLPPAQHGRTLLFQSSQNMEQQSCYIAPSTSIAGPSNISLPANLLPSMNFASSSFVPRPPDSQYARYSDPSSDEQHVSSTECPDEVHNMDDEYGDTWFPNIDFVVHSHQQQCHSLLDDTASSPIFNFSKGKQKGSRNKAFYFSQGISATYYYELYEFQKHPDLLQSSLPGEPTLAKPVDCRKDTGNRIG